MSKVLLFFGCAMFAAVALGQEVLADAELRLYNGDNEFDLKQSITIAKESGKVIVQNYKKVCSPFGGCKANPTDQLGDVAGIAADKLRELSAAIAGLGANAVQTPGKPAREAICEFYNRFTYRVVNADGSGIPVATFKDCSGTRLNDPNAATIESILNVAAANAGL